MSIDDLLDYCEGVEKKLPTQLEVREEAKQIWQRMENLHLEGKWPTYPKMNLVYRSVYNKHGLLGRYENWKLLHSGKRKSFLSTLPVK